MRKFINKSLAVITMSAVALTAIGYLPSAGVSVAGAQSGKDYTNEYAKAAGYSGADLVWSDEFGGTELNQNSWNIETGNNNGWGNHEKEIYTKRSDNIYIADISDDSSSDDGKALAIHAYRDSSGNYYSGRMQTAGKHRFKYGRMEARIKFENGMHNGVWPAFWMMGDNNTKGWPYCGEIDIMEHANAQKKVNSTLHWNSGTDTNASYDHKYQGGSVVIPGETIDMWHVYAIEWNKQKISFYIDDTVVTTQYITSEMNDEFNGHEFYFILNMAISGDYVQGRVPASNWEGSTMYVDYVRAYQNTNKVAEASNYGTWEKDSIWEKSEEQNTTAAPQQNNNSGNQGNASQSSNSNGQGVTTAAQVSNNADSSVTIGKTAVKKAKRNKTKDKVKLTFKKIKGADGYEYKISTSKKFKKKQTKTGDSYKISKTIKKLKPTKKYYVKARAFKLDADGQSTYGVWYKVKTIK